MTKRQLIDEIVSINRSAQPSFLARFDRCDLRDYLDNLHASRRPRPCCRPGGQEPSILAATDTTRPLAPLPMANVWPAPEPAAPEPSAEDQAPIEPVQEAAQQAAPAAIAQAEPLEDDPMDVEAFSRDPEQMPAAGEQAEAFEVELDRDDRPQDPQRQKWSDRQPASPAAVVSAGKSSPFASQEEDAESWLF